MIADVIGLVLMLIGLIGGIAAAADHTPYAIAGCALVIFVGAVLYHKQAAE